MTYATLRLKEMTRLWNVKSKGMMCEIVSRFAAIAQW